MEFTCTKCDYHTKIDTAIEVKNFGCPNCGSLFDFDEKTVLPYLEPVMGLIEKISVLIEEHLGKTP